MSIHEVLPQVRVRRAAEAIAFYVGAFGATERFRLVEPDGRIGHVELDFDGHLIFFSDEYPEHDLLGPETRGGTTVTLHLHVDDCDALLARVVAAGGTLLRGPTDQFYGERSGTVRDPFGHEWNIGHSIEAVTPDEMQRRYTAMFREGS